MQVFKSSFSALGKTLLSSFPKTFSLLVPKAFSHAVFLQTQFPIPNPSSFPRIIPKCLQICWWCNVVWLKLPRLPGFQEAFPTSCPATLSQSRLQPATISLSLLFSFEGERIALQHGVRRKWQHLFKLFFLLFPLSFPSFIPRAARPGQWKPFARHSYSSAA